MSEPKNLPAVTDAELAAHAVSIRAKVSKGMEHVFDAGRELIAVKKKMPHGQFTQWVEREIGVTARCARNWMAAAALGKTETVSVLAPTTVYQLAALPKPEREKILDLVADLPAPEARETVKDALAERKESEAAEQEADAANREAHTKAREDRATADAAAAQRKARKAAGIAKSRATRRANRDKRRAEYASEREKRNAPFRAACDKIVNTISEELANEFLEAMYDATYPVDAFEAAFWKRYPERIPPEDDDAEDGDVASAATDSESDDSAEASAQARKDQYAAAEDAEPNCAQCKDPIKPADLAAGETPLHSWCVEHWHRSHGEVHYAGGAA
jgi:hypothetical protein